MKALIKILLLSASVFFLRPAIGFAQPVVEAKLDKRIVNLDDTLTLSVTVRGGEMTTTPDIPSQGNFDVVGRSLGTSIEIINGHMTATKTFHYELSPRAAGDFTIGPIKVYMEGEEYKAGPLAVKVIDSVIPKSYQNPSPGQALPEPPPGYGFPFPQQQPQFPQFPGSPQSPRGLD